jgi:transcriptional regulator with XRE-family HTH domain
MDVERAGKIGRLLRVRARLTQRELALRAGVSRRDVWRFEGGHGRRIRYGTHEAILGALGARVDMKIMWNGPELDRLLDAGHAAIAGTVKRQLERWSWLVRVEVSYSRYGERGRIDLLTFHPPTETLVVVEIKTMLVDVQELLGSLDVKTRLAPYVAEQLGWRPRHTIPALVFAESAGTRAHIARLDTLFDRYPLRGRRALSWLRRPGLPPGGLLWFKPLPEPSLRSPQRVYRRSSAA